MSEFAKIFERYRAGEVKPSEKDDEESAALKSRLTLALLRNSKRVQQPATVEGPLIHNKVATIGVRG